MTITLIIDTNDSIETYDRYIREAEVSLSDAASAVVADALGEIEAITLDILAAVMEKVAAAGLPDVAMELAGVFSDVARELMRGRACRVA